MSDPTRSTVHSAVVAVIGGGVSGCLAARRLAQAGARVHLWESAPHLGGHVRTIDFAGGPVDVGAEALHVAGPGPRALLEELGLSAQAVAAAPGSSWLWTPKGRRRLPAGVGPAGPTRLRPVLSSGVMTKRGLLRAGLEPVVAAARGPLGVGPGTDMSVGAFTSMRFGPEVTQRFVDPLLGGLHSGDVDRLSLAACAPSLVGAANDARSLVVKRRTAPGPPGVAAPAPAFTSFTGGLSTLVESLLSGLPVATHLSARVRGVSARPVADGQVDAATSRRYLVEVEDGPGVEVDALVLAVPAPVAVGLLGSLAPDAAAPLRGTHLASTATVVLGFAPEDVRGAPALTGTGLLVPSQAGSLLKAATHLSTKWSYLAQRQTYLLRMSAGRAGSPIVDGLDDDALLGQLLRDLRDFDGICATPTQVHIHRWRTGLPQLTVGHLDRLGRARAALSRDAPGVALAGASYDGVGLTSCIASAQRAAEATIAYLREYDQAQVAS